MRKRLRLEEATARKAAKEASKQQPQSRITQKTPKRVAVTFQQRLIEIKGSSIQPLRVSRLSREIRTPARLRQK